MAHESGPFNNDDANIAHKLPHSGNMPQEQGGERPVHEFDNTPLDEAHRQGLIGEAPDTVHEGFGTGLTDEERQLIADRRREAAEQQEATGSHKKRNILIGGAAVVAAGAVAAGAMFGLGGKDKDDTPRANPTNPVATAPANPSQSHESKTNPSTKTSEKPSATNSSEFKSAVEVPAGFSVTSIPERLSTDNLSSKTPSEVESAFAIKSSSNKINPENIAKAWTEGYTAIGNLGCSEKYMSKYSDSIGNFDMDKFEKDSSDFAVTAFKGLNGKYGVDSTKTTEWKTQLANRCGTVYGVKKFTDKTLQPYEYQMMIDPKSVTYNGIQIEFTVFDTDNINNTKLTNDGMKTYPSISSGEQTVNLSNPTVENGVVNFDNITITPKAE